MNDAVFWRLVWKEYRFQRGFWVSIAAFTFLGQLIALLIPVPAETVHPGVFVLTFIMPVFYVLGCAGTLFASEHEEGTVERLRIMAASQGQLLGSKIAFASVSTALLVGVLWTTALLLSRGKLPEREALGTLLPLWMTGLLEVLAWGTLFSLLCRKVIHAVILAAVAWVISLVCLEVFLATPIRYALEQPIAVPIRIAMAACVFLLATAISRRWGHGMRWSLTLPDRSLFFRRWEIAETADVETTWMPMLRRLLWQEWRQSWKTIAILCIPIYGTFGVLVVLLGTGALRGIESEGIAFFLLVLSTLLGSRVFSAEQEAYRFRFLAHRGCSPSLVWFSKQILWVLTSFVTTWLLCGLLIADIASRGPANAAELSLMFFLLPLNYSVGQLVSMLARRGLYTVFLSLVLAGVFDAWVFLMHRLGVNLLLSVAPLPLILLFATWVRTADWMLERKTWAARLRLLATLGVPAVALLSGVVAYRVYEIPKVQVGFSLAEYLRPVTEEETATAELYRKAGDALVPIELPRGPDGRLRNLYFGQDGWHTVTDVEKDWLVANQEALRLTLKATGRENCVLRDPATQDWQTAPTGLQAMRELANLLLLDARRHEFNGELDTAKERYWSVLQMARHASERGALVQYFTGNALHNRVYERLPRWAAHPDQTTPDVVRAIHELQAIAEANLSITDSIKTEYLMLRGLFDDESPQPSDNERQESSEITFGRFWHLIPWERARGLRFVDFLGAQVYERVEQIERLIEAGEPYRDIVSSYPGLRFLDARSQTFQWLHTTLEVGKYYPAWGNLVRLRIDEVTARRACILIMALADHLREHGELPETLEELEGTYFTRLPVDPYSGKPFEYRPEGLPEAVEFVRSSYYKSEPGQPLLWSVGPIEIQTWLRSDGRASLEGYWAFPIPEVAGDETKGSP